jgi:hypothetical protein
VGDGNGELDVAHALTANAGDRHFDAAAIANDIPLYLIRLYLPQAHS